MYTLIEKISCCAGFRKDYEYFHCADCILFKSMLSRRRNEED